MFDEIKSKYGHLDVLLNNVGATGPVKRLHEIELKDVQSQYEINQLGCWHVLK
jgi:NAD(P)-dependent dehydrogenase (short-subunit alcohol dehydrogenase family)